MMHVLHAHWRPPNRLREDAALLLWAETLSGGGANARAKPASRRSLAEQRHPFCADAATLRDLLGDSGAREERFVLSLPGYQRGPLPSTESSEHRRGRKPYLKGWEISGLSYAPVEAVGVLMELLDDSRYILGVEPGDSMRYWQRASQLSLEALAQQRVAPGLRQREDGLYACWMPLIDGHRLEQLAGLMPPVCRAGVGDPVLPRALLESLLEEACDALMRVSGSLPQPLRDLSEPGTHWVQALFGPPAPIGSSAAQLEDLRRSHHLWMRNLRISGDEYFRVAFRLSEPYSADGAWPLEFMLQSREDPSLLVGVPDIWHGGEELTRRLRRLREPQRKLLTGLGYAARLFAPLERALQQSSTPEALELDADEAFRFLRECAPLLEEGDFGVLVPPWWNRSRARLGLRARVSPKSSVSSEGVGQGMMSMEHLLNYHWELSLGGQTLSKEEFETLAALKSPLVKLRGEWVRLDPEQVEAAIGFFKQRDGAEEIGVPEALRLGLGGVEEVEGLAVEEVDFEGWTAGFFEQLKGDRALESLPPPEGLHAELRPYQQAGYSWLEFLRGAGLGACLADDMGLGKCLAPDTLVPINGTLQKAEEIWQSYAGEAEFDGEGFWAAPTEELLVNSIDGVAGGIVQAPIRRLYRQRVRENLRTIHLEDGSSITITLSHQLLTSKGWTNKLRAGDHVCVPAKTVWEGQSEDPDLVTFLAWQMAEGHERRDVARVAISQKNVERLEGLRETLLRIGSRYALKINQPAIRTPRDRVANLTVSSKAYRQFLESKGYRWGRRSAEKEIPPFIMQADLDTTRVFLRHYFEAEASVSSRMRTVEISTASRLLIQQLSLLLRRFGIWLRVSEKEKRATNGSGVYRNYYMGTLGGESARKFLREIGFSGPEKQKKLKQVCEPRCNTNVEGIPASEVVARMVEKFGLPLRHLGMYNTAYTNGSQQFSRSSLKPVISAMDDVLSGKTEQQYRRLKPSRWTTQTLSAYADLDVPRLESTRRQLQRLLDQEVFYCKIEEIEETPYDGWVYDFEVVDHHNFVAENILCHNTVQTLALISRHQERREIHSPVLVVCPTSVVDNWHREAHRFTPHLRILAHQGPQRPRGAEFTDKLQETDLVVTSYAVLRRDSELLQEVDWHGVVLDEAQNIKNPASQQSKLAYGLRAGFKVALTGTPVENRLAELWSIMRFLNPGYLGSQREFRRHLARPIEREGDEEATKRLHALTGPLILRRLKSDPKVIGDLPDKQEMKVYCHLSEEQASLYEAVVQDAMHSLQESEGIQRKGQVLSMLTQLKQVCNHPAQFLHEGASAGASAARDGGIGRSGKLLRLCELLEETLSVGDGCLIFTQYKEMGALLYRTLPRRLGTQARFIHGGTPAKTRTRIVRAFQQEEGGPPLLILSLKAGGTGLNLTRANHVFHFDRWWNPAVEDQATDRAFRIGQERNVQVHKLVCGGTLEERIDEMIERKKALAESVVGASEESLLTGLSDQSLREMVKLGREALA